MKRNFLYLLFCLLMGLAIALPAHSQQAQGQAYVVQLNDTLWKLAEKYLGDGFAYPAIVSATSDQAAADASFNPVSDPNLIFPGQKLWIPGVAAVAEPATSQPPAVQPVAIPTPAPAISVATGSPSGHVAFSFWNDSANRCTLEINLINVPACLSGQCQPTRRIFALNNVSEPALSPDGNRLAFRGWGEPPSEDSPYVDCAPAHPYRHLGHATPDGTDYIGFGGFWEDSHPDWSPDGNRLLFDSGRNGDGITRIYMINADRSGEQDLRIIGQQPSWTRDGARFVYRGCDLTGNRCGLWLAHAFEPKSWETGINLIGPLVQADGVAHPDWSPTRDEIVYQRNEGGNWNLWLVNADGGNDHRLTGGPGIEGLPSWSPDGNWVVYLTHDGQNWALRIVSRDGTDDRQLFTYDGGIYDIPKIVEPYGPRSWIDEQISWSR
jgi:LysM repeat protein